MAKRTGLRGPEQHHADMADVFIEGAKHSAVNGKCQSAFERLGAARTHHNESIVTYRRYGREVDEMSNRLDDTDRYISRFCKVTRRRGGA